MELPRSGYSWPVEVNQWLAAIFAFAGLAGATLQYWLWTFPMAPDPGGPDPNGRTTAPRTWRMVHRALGYLFIAIYIVMLVRMWPRLGLALSGEATTSEQLHAAFGLLVAPILAVKIFVLRRAQRFGKRLRPLGTLVLGLALVLLALVMKPAMQLANLPTSSGGQIQAKGVLTSQCISCHGATKILNNDKEWHDVVEDMEEYASKSGRPLLLEGSQQLLIEYLQTVLPQEEQDSHEDEDDRK